MSPTERFTAESIPVHVSEVSFIGLGKTDKEFLKKQLKPLVRSTNLAQLLRNSSELKNLLVGLNIFKYCEVTIDTAKDSGRPDAYKVNVLVDERRPQTLKAQWSVATDGSTRLGGYYSLNNIFRKGERFEIESSVGRNATKMRSATLIKPLEVNPNIKLRLGGSDCSYDQWWSKMVLNESSLFTEVSALTRFGLHKLHWSNVWREIAASESRTPFELRRESGVTLKTNYRHSVEVDTRDDSVFPQNGCLLRLSQELSFLTPPPSRGSEGLEAPAPASSTNNDYSTQIRLEGAFQKPLRLTNWLVAEGTLSAGLVHSLSGHMVSVADRFFLGGPMELRGYRFYAAGPMAEAEMTGQSALRAEPGNAQSTSSSSSSSQSCPRGALASFVAGLHLYTPLPFIGGRFREESDEDDDGDLGDGGDATVSFARLHAFALTGCLLEDPMGALRLARAGGGGLDCYQGATSASVVGAGLALRFAGGLRLELNYCFPLAGFLLFPSMSAASSVPRPGFQLGFGLSYT